MTVTLTELFIGNIIMLLVGLTICGILLLYGIHLGQRLTHRTEDRERDFALKITNIEQGATPIEQDRTGEIIEQTNTAEKALEDIPPDNRSDLVEG